MNKTEASRFSAAVFVMVLSLFPTAVFAGTASVVVLR